MKEEIVEYYSKYDEHNRLLKRHTLERIRTQEIISRYLPSNKSNILDVGGATGVYSFWLTSLGHNVDLIDLTPKHIEKAKEIEEEIKIKLHSSVVGNALKLPYKDNEYDLVLLFGPLYHLQDKTQRIAALNEARRVLRPNGLVLAAVISRYASMLDGYKKSLIEDEKYIELMEIDLVNGKRKNPTGEEKYFTTSYFHHPNEIKEEIEEANYTYEKTIAVEGFGSMLDDIEDKLQKNEYRDLLLECIRKTESEATLFGMSFHLLGIGRKYL